MSTKIPHTKYVVLYGADDHINIVRTVECALRSDAWQDIEVEGVRYTPRIVKAEDEINQRKAEREAMNVTRQEFADAFDQGKVVWMHDMPVEV